MGQIVRMLFKITPKMRNMNFKKAYFALRMIVWFGRLIFDHIFIVSQNKARHDSEILDQVTNIVIGSTYSELGTLQFTTNKQLKILKSLEYTKQVNYLF